MWWCERKDSPERVAERVPLTARSHEHRARPGLLQLRRSADHEPSGEHVDRFVELVVGVRDGAGEPGGHGDLHGREPRRLPVQPGQNVHHLAGVGEGRPFSPVSQRGHTFY